MNKLLEWVISAVMTIVFGIMLAFVTIEWFAGCGESYIDAYGQRHLNQCVFINFPPKDYK